MVRSTRLIIARCSMETVRAGFEKLVFNFISKRGNSIFAKLTLSFRTALSIAMHSQHAVLHSAWELKARTWQAVRNSVQQDALCVCPRPVLDNLSSSFSQKIEDQFFETGLARLHTFQHCHKLTARIVLQSVDAARVLVARCMRATSAGCFVQLAGASLKKS